MVCGAQVTLKGASRRDDIATAWEATVVPKRNALLSRVNKITTPKTTYTPPCTVRRRIVCHSSDWNVPGDTTLATPCPASYTTYPEPTTNTIWVPGVLKPG